MATNAETSNWKKNTTAMETTIRQASNRAKSSDQPLMNTLYAEHRHMASVMQLFADQLRFIEQGQTADSHVVYEIMDYMVTWPDCYHHPREDLIYSRVAEVDARARSEVEALQRDHDQTASQGRKVLREIERWRDGEVSGNSVCSLGRAYIEHVYQHMNAEEQVVFPRIESVLTSNDWRELAEDDHLHAVADPVFGPQVQRDFRNLVRKLRRRTRRVVERGTLVEWIGIEALLESMEVLSMANESLHISVTGHVHKSFEDGKQLLLNAPLNAPLQITINNTNLTLALIEEVLEIGRDTLRDLSRLNQERKERARLVI